ncbi:MAG TPA: aminotransferase class III-fold pyridoxal phosphate-dependent enzyme [Anaerolineae bacterium]|nr:aminotransferase class III-fold pyridoxal phosphate-dependent enzyme [Anaerolineae bacterium]
MATTVTEVMTAEEMIALCKKYTLWSWSAQDAVNPIPMARAEGIYFWDPNGKRYIDMNSQLMCVNIGHGNQHVIKAIQDQAAKLAYAGPSMATEVRAKIGPMLAKHTPGDLNKFFFTLGGAEANENAIKLARQYTGRNKIITRYRSYHGATAGAITLTGDPRRWANEPGIPGVIRAFDPYEYRCPFCKHNPSGCSMDCLNHIEEIMMYENPNTIAAVFIETVTGTNGLIVPPDGYLQGLRELCTKHGILLICDEVMAGLGRTGEWFAVDNWGVVPDIITMAKGLTSAYLPLGCVAMKESIAEYFGKNVYYGGLTYNAHPMSLAAAVATLEVLENEDVIGNARRMGKVMSTMLDDLKAEHPSVGDVRSIGLFGVIELVKNRETREPLAPFNVDGTEPMKKLGGYLKEHGMYAFTHWNLLFTNPPLIITEQQLMEAFDIINEALAITDQAVV